MFENTSTCLVCGYIDCKVSTIHVVCSPCCQVMWCYLAGTKCNSAGRLLSCGMRLVAEMVSHNVFSYVLNSPSYFHA